MSNSPDPQEMRSRAYRTASHALEGAKRRRVKVQAHRALNRLPVGPSLLIQGIGLPLLFCVLLVWAEPYLMDFWRGNVLFWAAHLDLPFRAGGQAAALNSLQLDWAPSGQYLQVPDFSIWAGTALMTGVAFILSFRLNDEKLPLKYLVRILCVVQAAALLFFLLAPTQFPYTVAHHMDDLVKVGYVLILMTPVMLALGYYLLNVGVAVKIVHTILILAYFVCMIPYQIVLHALILHHFSLLFMPLLFICFGPVFDVLIFVALYSWVASTLPATATN